MRSKVPTLENKNNAQNRLSTLQDYASVEMKSADGMGIWLDEEGPFR